MKLDIPLQEAIGVCFIVHRSPFGDDIKNPMESEIQLAQEGEEQSETMVFEREETINEE